MIKIHTFLLVILLISCQDNPPGENVAVEQGTSTEIELISHIPYGNPYTDVEVWAVFINSRNDTLVRPGFWDGDLRWKIRFNPPDSISTWYFETFASNPKDDLLNGVTGTIQAEPYQGHNNLEKHGLLRMSRSMRNVEHADGTPFLVVGDTPWALPFRATKEDVTVYAQDRKKKGFNTALLMSVQPDMRAEGPNARQTPLGFKRGFRDLSEGHINHLEPTYFQYLDTLINILLDHEIVPVFQPVFHGFGWKGLDVLGNYVEPEEYVRYCKYLLARYGSKPAFWLIAGDNGGNDPGVAQAGEMLEKWDCYRQPTGLHYNPCDDYVAEWAVNNPLKHCMHLNRTHQAKDWLDFQWAQTGHNGEHLYHKVSRMYENKPIKACANGEPTYEGMNGGKNGLGWWQGEEAWMQFMSGGTMGVVYGAAALWQWKISADEPGWSVWGSQSRSWKEALFMEGSTYVGLLAKGLEGLDLSDIEKRWDLTVGNKPLLAKEGSLYISYLNEGGSISIPSLSENLLYHWFNPKSGERTKARPTRNSQEFVSPDDNPWVLIIHT